MRPKRKPSGKGRTDLQTTLHYHFAREKQLCFQMSKKLSTRSWLSISSIVMMMNLFEMMKSFLWSRTTLLVFALWINFKTTQKTQQFLVAVNKMVLFQIFVKFVKSGVRFVRLLCTWNYIQKENEWLNTKAVWNSWWLASFMFLQQRMSNICLIYLVTRKRSQLPWIEAKFCA